MKCLTCKRNTEFKFGQKKKTKNGVYYAVGNCSVCGRRQSLFLGKGIYQNWEKGMK